MNFKQRLIRRSQGLREINELCSIESRKVIHNIPLKVIGVSSRVPRAPVGVNACRLFNYIIPSLLLIYSIQHLIVHLLEHTLLYQKETNFIIHNATHLHPPNRTGRPSRRTPCRPPVPDNHRRHHLERIQLHHGLFPRWLRLPIRHRRS